MIQILDHKIFSSLKEYINYRILKDLQAYKHVNLTFNKYVDTRLASKNTYGSSYPFWVYDDSITSGVASGIGSLNRGVSGLAVDFKNGRFITNTGVTLPTGSANIPVNEFHVYVTTKSEMELINESNFMRLPDLKAATSPLAPDNIILPAIFLRSLSTNDDPYSFGGTDWTIYNVRAICITNNMNEMFGLQYVMRDLKERVFPLLDNTPLNEYNDLKTSPWNYETIMSMSTNNIHILDSTFQNIQSDFIAEKNPQLYLGIGVIKIGVVRQPRL
jgi:hypothetical protein